MTSSPPCFAHELAENADGSFSAVDDEQQRDVMRWRKAERQRLVGARLAISAAERQQMSESISASLKNEFGEVGGKSISFYWPFRGEPDLRALMAQLSEMEAICALPVVTAKGQPLTFRSWRQGEELERGAWNIPVPAKGGVVTPDIVISPVVGFDPLCFRLGYGGGFFDRTLAAMQTKPHVLGVGYTSQAIPTIYPQPHDIPLDCIVTEAGIVRPDLGKA
ncbi:MAG: 5-formyltetrahydrofolate cyclo-ligase [Nitratireductor sp.]